MNLKTMLISLNILIHSVIIDHLFSLILAVESVFFTLNLSLDIDVSAARGNEENANVREKVQFSFL